MKPGQILYKAGYHYQLAEDYAVQLGIRLPEPIRTVYINLSDDGWLFIRRGYAWDGPSGPAIDTRNFMRGSLIHDALYQLLRLGLLGAQHRAAADLEMWRACREDGMSRLRAWLVWVAVDIIGAPFTSPSRERKILVAP